MTLLEYLPKVYPTNIISRAIDSQRVTPRISSLFYKKDLGKLLVLQVFSRLNFVLLNLLLVFTILVVLIILIEIAQIGKIA